jgi:hypothetical protein
VVFVTKNDRYIYGYNINVLNQPKFSKKELTKNKKPIILSPNATFTTSDVFEVYLN